MFGPIGSHVIEAEQYSQKNPKNGLIFFSKKKKKKKKSERMAQGKQQLKFERNPHIGYRYNCDTDGRTTDGRRTIFDFMSSADIVEQS